MHRLIALTQLDINGMVTTVAQARLPELHRQLMHWMLAAKLTMLVMPGTDVQG
jgi:hypothetical protein